MASFFSRLFGGSREKSPSEGGPAEQGEPVLYKDLVIRPAPERAGSQWRLAGVIIKDGEDGRLERVFLRADTFSSRDEAETSAIAKGKQIIDEQGMRLFADGAPTGRA